MLFHGLCRCVFSHHVTRKFPRGWNKIRREQGFNTYTHILWRGWYSGLYATLCVSYQLVASLLVLQIFGVFTRLNRMRLACICTMRKKNLTYVRVILLYSYTTSRIGCILSGMVEVQVRRNTKWNTSIFGGGPSSANRQFSRDQSRHFKRGRGLYCIHRQART